MYPSISFYLNISSLASLMCRNRLGCLGYKYVPPFIVKSFVTRPIQTHLLSQVPYLSALGVVVM